VEQAIIYVCAAGGLAGIAAVLTVFVNHSKYKRDNQLETLVAQMQTMQASFDSQLKAMQTSFDSQLKAMQVDAKNNNDAFRVQLQGMVESVNSWKGLWETSKQEIRELKMEIKELRAENDKLRSEILELKGQLKEHYKLA
jgi:chromosome segregation ATPase